MKKILATALLLACSLPLYAQAVSKTVTVKEAKTLRDDTRVALTGKITGRAGGDHYWLQDSTGKIRIDVEDDDWEDNHIRIGKTVRVVGDVDKNDGHTEIEVDHIRIVR